MFQARDIKKTEFACLLLGHEEPITHSVQPPFSDLCRDGIEAGARTAAGAQAVV